MKTIKLKVDDILADRVQYKPYSAHLSNPELYVQVTVGDQNVVSQKGEETVLTPDGLASVMRQIAVAIETMDEDIRKEQRKKLNV